MVTRKRDDDRSLYMIDPLPPDWIFSVWSWVAWTSGVVVALLVLGGAWWATFFWK